MKIENLRREHRQNRVRIAATVIWENCDRPPQELYFETPAEFAEDFACNPNAFLLATALPAMRYGEQRIAIAAPICPRIKEGLTTVMHCLVNWYGGDRRVIPIEAPLQHQPLFVANRPRAAGFFSGGIDALSMVRTNHLNFPVNHPDSIQDGILVYGILNGEDHDDPSFQHVIDGVMKIAKDTGIQLLTVSSNAYAHIRDLDRDFQFWKREFHGAFLAAVAHAFAPRYTCVSIASSSEFECLEPWGSHPMIDHYYSSPGLRIHHANADLSRFQKTRVVAGWEAALQNLRVCNEKSSYQQGNHNCGQCEKCIRTMTALLALGKLDQTTTFPSRDVSRQLLVNNVRVHDTSTKLDYLSLVPLLEHQHRTDLVEGIHQVIRKSEERDLAGYLKRCDRALSGGRLLPLLKRQFRRR